MLSVYLDASLTLSSDFHSPSANHAGKLTREEALTITVKDTSSLFLLICLCLGSFHCVLAPIAKHYTCENCLLIKKKKLGKKAREKKDL